MSAMTDYLENKLIDQILRGQGFSFPSTLYLALCSAEPSQSGTVSELSGPGYSRASISASLSNFSGTQGAGTTTASTGASGESTNNVDVEYGNALGEWGAASHVAVFDAATGGNLLLFGELKKPKLITSGMKPKFKVGTIKFTIAATA